MGLARMLMLYWDRIFPNGPEVPYILSDWGGEGLPRVYLLQLCIFQFRTRFICDKGSCLFTLKWLMRK